MQLSVLAISLKTLCCRVFSLPLIFFVNCGMDETIVTALFLMLLWRKEGIKPHKSDVGEFVLLIATGIL